MQELLLKLERYPHIQQRIKLFWGYKECRDYLQQLIMQKDRPNRRGFPANDLFTIHSILDLHDTEYPDYIPLGDVWSDSVM